MSSANVNLRQPDQNYLPLILLNTMITNTRSMFILLKLVDLEMVAAILLTTSFDYILRGPLGVSLFEEEWILCQLCKHMTSEIVCFHRCWNSESGTPRWQLALVKLD